MRTKLLLFATGLSAVFALAMSPAVAHPPAVPLSGAIFTTDSSGVPVNLNIYDSKEDVYLNGGPGINAPDDAAGLPAGDYYFQVTDPSGKTLLSSDAVECRVVTVDGSGVFTSLANSDPSCVHEQGSDGEDGGITVQLMPYDDTPNNGGVYKVWITPVGELDCDAPGNKHCFVPHHSKTDNFKVEAGPIVEIDTRFWKDGQLVDGLGVTWTDTLGASNKKYSEYRPEVLAFHEAHVEAAEQGWHQITIADQAGCTVHDVRGADGKLYLPTGGSVTVGVNVKNHNAGDATYFVDVTCE